MIARAMNVNEKGSSPAHDLPTLSSMVIQLVGEKYLFARFGYGDELTLHFGTPREAKNSVLRAKGIRYGTYILRSRGSGWLLKSGIGNIAFDGVQDHLNPAILNSQLKLIDEKDIETGNFLTPGVLVYEPFICTVKQVDGIGLRLDMTDGSSVLIVPAPDEPLEANSPELPEIADWELETPLGTLRVGPGQQWGWVESNQSPNRDLPISSLPSQQLSPEVKAS